MACAGRCSKTPLNPLSSIALCATEDQPSTKNPQPTINLQLFQNPPDTGFWEIQLVLPNPQHAPARPPQGAVYDPVAGFVVLDFTSPPCRPVRRPRRVLGTATLESTAIRPADKSFVAWLEHFQLLRSAGFPACGFRRLSSRLFRADQSRDKNVPQTRRHECLRYIKVVTALMQFSQRK